MYNRVIRAIRAHTAGAGAAVLALALVLAGGGLLWSTCTSKARTDAGEGPAPYYLAGLGAREESAASLFSLLGKEAAGTQEHFAVIREIANCYAAAGDYGKLVTFLSDAAREDPQSIYNGYYRFMTAWAYMRQEAWPAAALYFDIILKNYPDLIIQGESMHLACLNQLITLVNDGERRVRYYEELIARFPEQIDLGAAYFMLGQAYEKTGEWSEAIKAYTQYLPYLETNVPGFPNAASYARNLVDFYNSPKNWTFDSLSSLLAAVRASLDGGNAERLDQCRAKVNFFARSWGQEDAENAGMAEFTLYQFMQGNRIRYNDELDKSSNANEAYLRTTGWAAYIATWYLYFRKIYFPANPEIHGRWEWAGIYYGEKF
ncbi:MAG: tetratricopeptide repeat protein [Treponema sp.]|jgi:hypothetical protein|nr:tetratricopeptide repeat protein [Treponema sp.]